PPVVVATMPQPYSSHTPRHKRPGFWPRLLEIEPPVSGAFGIAVGVRTWPAAVPAEWRLLRPQRHAGRAGGGDRGGSADFTSSRPPNRTRLRAPSGRVPDWGPPRSPPPVNIAAGAGSLSPAP